MKKRVVYAASILSGVLVTWAGWILIPSYLTSPAKVSALESSGVLAFPSSGLARDRLCALLVVQDPTFYRHQGIALLDGPPGHTTLTQGVAKMLFFDGFSPGLLHQRKIQLMLDAWAFDRRISKDTQLRIFLNRVYFGSAEGHDVLGFPDAANSYYGKPLTSLSDMEFYGLLAMISAPNQYHVLRHPKENADRAAYIRKRVELACRGGCFQGERPVPCPSGGAQN